jgi:hypothetical protein
LIPRALLALVVLVTVAVPASVEAAWVLWTAQTQDSDEWKLHSAYTLRATCLVMSLLVRPEKRVIIPESVTGDTRRTIVLRGKTWCLPASVRPE